jgi:4-amino-4-deoxy-L-arabinose transferase-like glycosyltransferase
VLSGVAVGLGFEAKMAVALMVAPGIAAAWLWIAPAARGRLHAMRQLLLGGAALVAVGGAWPLLMTLTPASDRPWISGTSDNSVWSLIFSYNGVGRLAGQTGGPGGGPGGGGMFGGGTGPLRLLQSSLGDQAGWLLGFAVVAGVAILVVSRLRRHDPRMGWLMAIGGAFLTIAVAFSFASGIFHPYYVSLLAPFTAALIGAGAGMMLEDRRRARVIAPLAIAGGIVTELVVLGELDGLLGWARWLVLAVGAATAGLLMLRLPRRTRGAGRGGAGRADGGAGDVGHRDPGPRHQQHLPDRWTRGRRADLQRQRRWPGRGSARRVWRRRRVPRGQWRVRASPGRSRTLIGRRSRRRRRSRHVRRRGLHAQVGDQLRQVPRRRHDRGRKPEHGRSRDPQQRR